jgi:hypothetical protein
MLLANAAMADRRTWHSARPPKLLWAEGRRQALKLLDSLPPEARSTP